MEEKMERMEKLRSAKMEKINRHYRKTLKELKIDAAERKKQQLNEWLDNRLFEIQIITEEDMLKKALAKINALRIREIRLEKSLRNLRGC